jgi:hypothetical protein
VSSYSRRAALTALFAIGLQCVAGRARADDLPQVEAPDSSVAWSSLSPDEQKLLNRYGDRWSSLPRLLRGTRRWMSMTPEQRERAKARHARWKELTPEQREQARKSWRRYQELSPDQQERVRDGYHRFKNLTPEQRRRLRERWQNASPEERQRMLERRRKRQERRN